MSQKTILSFFKQAEPRASLASSSSKKIQINAIQKDLKKADEKSSEKPNAKNSVQKPTSPCNGIKNGHIPSSKQDDVKNEVKEPKSMKTDDLNDSPVKQTRKRKRAAQIIESDDEENSEANSKASDEMDVDCSAKGDIASTSNINHKLNDEQNLEESAEKAKKRKKSSSILNYDEEILTNTVTKKKDKEDSVSPNSKDGEKSSTSSNKSEEFIPKRKTARKQMRSSAKTKTRKDSDKAKSPSVEKDKGKTSEISDDNSASTSLENESCEKEKNDMNDSLNKDLEKNETPKDAKNINNTEKKPIHPFFGSTSKQQSSEEIKPKKSKSSSSTGIVYDPSKSQYHPIEDAFWKHGEKVPYFALAKTMELIEGISGRLKIIEMLSNYFRSVIVLSPEDLLCSVYLCLNRIAPEYEGIELGVGEMLLMKAVAQATGRTVEKIKADVAVEGDLGTVAESSRGNQKVMFAPPKLTVASVFQKFKEIAKMSGNSAMSKKTDKIQSLFVACRECEARYIIRSLSGKLRIGLAEQSVLAALARAAVLTPPNQSYPPDIIDYSSKKPSDKFKEHLDKETLILKTTYCECPNFDQLIPVLLREGISGLPEHCQLQPGCPLKPMLASPTIGVEEVLKRFDQNEFTCEFKYDGERAQIHMTEKGEVKIFSRNQEDNTSKYPDIISRIPKSLKESTKSFILDTEAVAWDCESQQILPFQVLSTRKKKNAAESEITVQVCIMAFDLLYLNGESLVKKPLKDRRDALHSAFAEVANEFKFVDFKDGNSADTMQEYLDESIKGNCEGLMVKSLLVDASYEIAKRSHNWLKLKKDYLKGLGDTLDLLVIGGYYGKGKRKGNFGGFLLACRDVDSDEFQSICKLGTGFTETELKQHTQFLKDHVRDTPRPDYRFDPTLKPDVWFEDKQIWEIKCADLSISPIHRAAIGLVDPEKGISLRFPRFVRIRADKSPENATTSAQVADMYEKQEQVQNTKNINTKSEEDYY